VGQIHHSDEEALANVLVEANLSGLEHVAEEVRAVSGALERIRLDTYGVCVDCGQLIDAPRLEAYPTAERCIGCQDRHEQAGARGARPSGGLRGLDTLGQKRLLL